MNEMLADEYNETEQEGFVIDNLDKAAWAFRKINACNAHIAEVQSYIARERERLDKWEQKKLEDDNNSINFFKNLLADYYFRERSVNPKFKLSTPYGSGYGKKQQPEMVYAEDAPEKLEAIGLGEFVKVKKEVEKADLKKQLTIVNNRAVTADGEILDFIEIVPKGESFVIRSND